MNAVEFLASSEAGLTSGDPGFVGATWVAAVVISLLPLVVAFVFVAEPLASRTREPRIRWSLWATLLLALAATGAFLAGGMLDGVELWAYAFPFATLLYALFLGDRAARAVEERNAVESGKAHRG